MCVCEDEELQSWGWTDLSSDSSAVSDSEKEQQIASFLQARTMSRRSLRLDDGLLDRSLPHGSTSFSVGGATWRSNRSLKSRRSQQLSVSCSESLLVHTPRKETGLSLHNSSVHSVASDASLISSLMDESSIQETTLVDTLWGLDQDIDPKESTIIAEQSTVLADRTLIGSDARCPKHPVHTLSKVYCKDCEEHSDRKESTYCSSSKYISSSSSRGPAGPETSIIYSRDRSRKSRTGESRDHRGLDEQWDVLRSADRLSAMYLCSAGVLLSVWDRSVACVVSLLSLLYHHLMLHKHRDVTARSSHGGVMNLRESTSRQKENHPNGSLFKHTPALLTPTGDDCKEKQRSQSDTASSSSWSSVTSCLLGLMWSAAVFTASSLLQLTLGAASAVWPLTKNVCSACVSAGCSAAGDVYTWLSRRWPSSSCRFPLRLLLVLLPLLLLLLSLCWFGPAALQSVLPAVNITEWGAVLPDTPALSSIYSSTSPQSRPVEGAEEETREVQPNEEMQPNEEEESAAVDESVRLVRLEQSLTALWERVEAGGRRAEQRHREVLRLYSDLQQQQVSALTGGQEAWLSGLLDLQLEQIKTRLEEERRSREQTRQQDLLQQQSQSSRLEELERQLQALAARTQVQNICVTCHTSGRDVQQGQDAATTASPSPTLPAAVSGGVDRQSHDALLAEVVRLEAALEDVRRDVQSVSGCQDGCGQLDRIQQTVSAQVREEVRTLVYGNQLMMRGGASADLPESLLQWLSQQYVSGADLQGALASLELSILQNISQQLEQHRSDETLREAVLHAAGAAGAAVSQEDVHAIVTNALRLFSQDRTGLADYALESGGGSIMSTRCSETYETKAALLSLFGVPLWYYSQSPRVVIQPDVHPGNCWAFRGSTGFLVIRLSMRILPSAFSLEHIPKTLAPSGTLRSAPRDFSVYGLEDEGQERGKLLGTYTYDEDGESLQTYPVSENEQVFQVIEVQVSSNWGHPEYTCLYRVRVHGTPADV
uniref:SUN domain-containing protein 1-like n=1 Tax=Semicossyphus pulcher TaxID=241346 RepID=UPI0037E98165